MLINRGIPTYINIISQLCSKVSQRKPSSAVRLPGSPCFFHTTGCNGNKFALQTQQENGLSRRRPISHGQNLSHRYIRLENALRGKTGYLAEMSNLTTAGGIEPMPVASSSKGVKVTQKTFMGLIAPEKPTPPADDGMLYTMHFYLVAEELTILQN